MLKKTCLCAVLILAVAAGAEAYTIGILGRSAITESDFNSLISTGIKWRLNASELTGQPEFKFFNNLSSLVMALNAGTIDAAGMPKAAGEYVLNTNSELKIVGVAGTIQGNLSLGFLKDNANMCRMFSYALRTMKRDGTLDELTRKYTLNPGKNTPEAVEFAKFPKGETVKVALTGDMPPLDYVDEAGNPAGFNTAILSEIGKRLEVNIECINIDAAARVSVLTSGRADAVFWFQFMNERDKQPDVPDDTVMLTEPYYSWDIFTSLGRK